jgi:hypothetical protein
MKLIEGERPGEKQGDSGEREIKRETVRRMRDIERLEDWVAAGSEPVNPNGQKP